jgi:ParB family chromosome partitioning protein
LQEQLALDIVRHGLSVRAVEEAVRAAVRANTAPMSADAEHDVGSAGGGNSPVPGLAVPPEGGSPESVAGGQGAGVRGASVAPGTRLRPPGILDLEELLGDHLNTRVTVDMGSRHGRVVIEFANLDDLERIYRVIIAGDPSPE